MTQKQLTEAMSTEATLGRATGVVMERFQLGVGQAFEFLTRVARINDMTIEAVAAHILDEPKSL